MKKWFMTSVAVTLATLFMASDALTRSKVKYHGNAIRKTSAPWAIKLQGLCHDEDNFYVTQRNFIWKIPRRFHMEKVKKTSARDGIMKAPIPTLLRLLGANHMGDCDVHDGLIYIPLEGAISRKILILSTHTLKFMAAPPLPRKQVDAPWVTVDKKDGTIISGNFNIKAHNGLYRYRLTDDLQTLLPVGKIKLQGRNGENIKLRRIQLTFRQSMHSVILFYFILFY